MKMHVGARGGEYLMHHFDQIIDMAKDSPENMQAALDEIEMYAKEVAQPITGMNVQTQTAPQAAIDYLKTHPELKNEFKTKYGYIPEGI